MRGEVSFVHPYPGINWRLITVLPEATFLAQANATWEESIITACAAVAAGLLLGLNFARRLSRPLKRLSDHVARVGGGDFDARLELRGAHELVRLAGDVNVMAAGLRHRMELEYAMSVATHVQQSLLPAEVPRIAGLDIAACSRYCDTTGGDYYDFICSDDGTLMLAVGDVTGHGIGAALLMATARAAVRAAAPLSPALDQLMGEVNRVLTQDTRHGMFMTLVIAVIDPLTRRAALVQRRARRDHRARSDERRDVRPVR